MKDLNDLHSKKFLIDREMRHLKSEGEALKSVLSDYRSQADEKAKLLREIEKVKTHRHTQQIEILLSTQQNLIFFYKHEFRQILTPRKAFLMRAKL